ncbi:hypothetical protein [Hymenobacter weizhouensis]|uniref:hypothetical protein n=1 Tax=Hymenobacter sp. YIM 151500-1 TaxID=2987689 RepID=UPI00222726AE|nr:hypothetical protein [Hymenobacter sp. YIM 151500-1]UYZ65259.1 hypothetical protein OIS53_19925 [Hymenobacter sp. YIM 151500-1]
MPTRKKLPQYERRVVAFIDILGFKNFLGKGGDASFNTIYNALAELQDRFAKPMQGWSTGAKKALNINTQALQVSDCLIISRLAEEKGGVQSMLFDCAYAIHTLIRHGFLCRGAIKVGEMYHNGNMLFGEAYVRAYLAEESERLPIIKFDSELFDLARQYPAPSNEGFGSWEENFVRQNCKQLMTDTYYLDYFTDYDDRFGPGEGEASVHYHALRQIIVNGLALGKNASPYEKFRWAADQFNLSANRFQLPPI